MKAKTIGEQAYVLKQQGFTWREIGPRLNTTSASAQKCARDTAEARKWAWPIMRENNNG